MTKKNYQNFWRIKRNSFREKSVFSREKSIFSKNCMEMYRNLTLGFLGLFFIGSSWVFHFF